nr:MAG TPA: hypothetical protein [Caudoviricetes sp.]
MTHCPSLMFVWWLVFTYPRGGVRRPKRRRGGTALGRALPRLRARCPLRLGRS